jgi:drug/metabolite transporter (DMT)-like permease
MLAPLAAVLIWSGNTVVTKAASGVIAPGSIAFYRWALALLIFAPFVARSAWRNRVAAAAVWKQLLALSLLGMVAYQSLAYVAAQTTTAANMGIIIALMPLCSSLLASLFSGERLTIAGILGAILSIAGLVYLIARGDLAGLARSGIHPGDGLMLLAVLSNSLYSVLLKRWSMTLSLWQQLFWQIVFATIILFPIWLLGPISPITAANLPLILYAAIPTSLLAPFLWMRGISLLGAARASITINILPVAVALLAWLILGEQLHAYHYIGGGVCLLGVILGLREWSFGKAKA